MNLQLIEQHKLIVQVCEDLLQLVFIEDKDIVNKIMNKSQLEIHNYNQENSTIIDATKTELGLFTAMVKRVVEGKYINPLIRAIIKPKDECDYDYLCEKEELQFYVNESGTYREEYYDFNLFCDTCRKEFNERLNLCEEYGLKVEAIVKEFKKACDDTVFTDDLRSRKISLTRAIVVKHNPTELQKKIVKQIHKQVLLVFEQQNKELLLKYNF